MTSLRHNISPAAAAYSMPVPADRVPSLENQPRRNVALMRKYEAAALLPDLTISFKSHVAPATPLFEETSSAFARGTLIPTVRGPVAIEDLLPGDYVETAGGAEPVMWIGSTSYVPSCADQSTSLTSLTRVTSGSYGLGRPDFDLLVGPAARMVVRHPKLATLLGQDSVLAPVMDYADGDRLFTVTPAGTVQMYHLMMRRHTTLMIGGIEMETYHPGKSVGQALGQNLRALFLSMFPNISQLEDFGQVSMTRTSRDVIDNLIDC
ncbi:Hint domain-containing protein [Tropicibacter oceani]|uniref:Hint domain-containing protein n=1 Tax=Tropicibacter oceani TaxID=3058420 RepID=A0ABY8QK81_9RHOB|nr:Hint domain-containing protein [Tropicibacter oceani]WGW04227.1 Hint domain-containing protein [Tropicibacter oceani]